MRVLVTTDTVTGTWTYTRELVSGLVSQGARVTLVSFGEISPPRTDQWTGLLHGLEYRPTAFRLEWMQEGEADFKDASNYLTGICREQRPDIFHTTQFCFSGTLPVQVPKVVVAQGDSGQLVARCPWARTERIPLDAMVSRHGNSRLAGCRLGGATPTQWMQEMLARSYVRPPDTAVVHNGRNPIFFNPYVTKEESIPSIGRLWDAGKQVNLLTQQRHAFPVCIVGADHPVALPATSDTS